MTKRRYLLSFYGLLKKKPSAICLISCFVTYRNDIDKHMPAQNTIDSLLIFCDMKFSAAQSYRFHIHIVCISL